MYFIQKHKNIETQTFCIDLWVFFIFSFLRLTPHVFFPKRPWNTCWKHQHESLQTPFVESRVLSIQTIKHLFKSLIDPLSVSIKEYQQISDKRMGWEKKRQNRFEDRHTFEIIVLFKSAKKRKFSCLSIFSNKFIFSEGFRQMKKCFQWNFNKKVFFRISVSSEASWWE